jgi:hypothetical protein
MNSTLNGKFGKAGDFRPCLRALLMAADILEVEADVDERSILKFLILKRWREGFRQCLTLEPLNETGHRE